MLACFLCTGVWHGSGLKSALRREGPIQTYESALFGDQGLIPRLLRPIFMATHYPKHDAILRIGQEHDQSTHSHYHHLFRVCAVCRSAFTDPLSTSPILRLPRHCSAYQFLYVSYCFITMFLLPITPFPSSPCTVVHFNFGA